MTNLTAAGYIIQDNQATAIYGSGQTVDEAWAEVVDGAGPFLNASGEAMDDEEAYTSQFTAYGATAALLEQINREGGDISWGVVHGVACTDEEEELANKTMYTVNEKGIAQIAEFIRQNHKDGTRIANTPSCLNAWAGEAEESMESGNPPIIEIRSWDSNSCATVSFTVSPDGIDIE